MSQREKVFSAFRHEESESIPAYVRIIENWESHKEYFQVEKQEELFNKLGNTIRSFAPEPLAQPSKVEAYSTVTIDKSIWGIPTEFAGTHSSLIERPLGRAETIDDVDNHPWPSGTAWDFTRMNEKLMAETKLARLSPSWMPVFSRLTELFGMEKALTDLYLNRPVIEAALSQIDHFYSEFYKNMLSGCGKNIDIFGLGDDFATNTGLMFEPEIWRELFKPLYAKYIGMAKEHGLLTLMHSCGNITSILPDLIEIGLDGWQTVQTHLPGQSTELIKREYGKHLTFIGAIDSTNILCDNDPEAVRNHVRKQINTLGRGGGYICAPDHIIMSDVPSENIEALYDECKNHRLS